MPTLWPAIAAILLLVCSCCVMTVAWYLHLKYSSTWPMWKAILISWLIAGGEYCLQVPANRIGHTQAQMPAATLRAIAEFCILVSFLVFQQFVLCEPIRWNHLLGFAIVFVGVLVVLGGPFPQPVLTTCEVTQTADALRHHKLEEVS
ncbi:hypothetical protein GUITHDRAFT_150380, partial [Guillardia theta CCMP2712]|mmetsp:Transcript_49543/g.155220  ORF Transcript_49543/g.155220 Transcript_49543/m.155220 type:complete len:147 (-) Transcript_49543:72-512(-)